jgi:hypothetical protein
MWMGGYPPLGYDTATSMGRLMSSFSDQPEIKPSVCSKLSTFGDTLMSLDKKAQLHRMRKASKRVSSW